MARKTSKLKQAEMMLEDQLDVAGFANNGYLYKLNKDDCKECKQRKVESIVDKICISAVIVSAVFVLWYGIEVIKLVVSI